jgi:peptidoglycan/xylan/chitin deacetylase (PgdA/CDA1 family)
MSDGGPSYRDVLVLCYHGVSPSWPDPTAVTPFALRRQVERLLARGWQPATFTEAVTRAGSGRTLAVTFDDALSSVIRLGWGVLRELGVPATVFAPTAFVESGGPFGWPGMDRWLGTQHESELVGMTWDELAQLRDDGWEIGSHSASHTRLTGLDDAELAAELRDSKRAIEARLGGCRSLAYPYSDVDERVAALARAAGYEAGAAVLPVRHRGDPMRFPRVPMVADETRLQHRLHLSRWMRRLQATRPWPAVQWVARALGD